MVRKIIAGILMASLLLLPVLADGESNEESGLEDNSDSQQDITVIVDLDQVESDLSTIVSNQNLMKQDISDLKDNSDDIKDYVEDMKDNQNVINNNLVFLVSAIISCAGLFVGYWTGKDLLDFLW